MIATGLAGFNDLPGPYWFLLAPATRTPVPRQRENRLTGVIGAATETHVYDGDGNRVRSVITAGGAVTETHYVGKHYEKTVNSGDTKYYYMAGQLVAFERSSGYGVDWGRRFVFRDHLGSTSVIINGASGLLLWRERYLPFGDVRDTYRKDNNPNFSLQTAYRFTGQRLESRLGTPENGLDRGLYFYGSRWYDSSLGRFLQADTIVPQPGNPQSLNRYSYALNNPLKYVDPSGHATTAVIPPGWFDLSKVQIDVSNWPEMAKSLAVAGCFIVGCRVNRETNVISGPTQAEALEAGMIGMVNPIGSGTGLLANAGKRAIQEGSEQAAKQLAKQVGEAELQKIVQEATVAGKRVVVIGENMKDRVIPLAKSIGAEWYKPRSPIAENWMKNNMRWIQQQIKEGAVIIDMGEDAIRSVRSEYYAMEKRILEAAGYVVIKVAE